ncbi:hypothetical protein [Micromonospora sp. LOL_023]|uniref:hypothetical protein n=1 Tax=Micromonospora sp. LOL_023 TaxID=3345418 RepID=UPI003A890365
MTARRSQRRPGTPNPADDRAFHRALQRQVDALAATVTLKDPPDGLSVTAEREWREQVAAAWLYLSCVAVWAEDHQLVEPLLRSAPPGIVRNAASAPLWLGRAFEALTRHPCTQWLLHPEYNPMLWAGAPSAAACDDLIRWWATQAPSLAWPDQDGYPPSISGWVIGDLLQILSPQRRARHALVQTPHYVADFILDRTLRPAADTFREEPVLRLIDPTVGTGHYLVRAVDYLWQWYTAGRMDARSVEQPPITGGHTLPPGEAIRRILAGVDGVDIDPLTVAVARLRMTVYLGHLLADAGLLPRPLRLAAVPAWVTPRIAVGDSLLIGKISRAEYGRLHPHLVDLPGAAFPLPGFTWTADEAATTAPPRRGRRS